MKKSILFGIILSVLLLNSCYLPISSEKGNGNIVKKEVAIPNVKELLLKGSGDVYITKGEKPSLFIETDENILSLLDTKTTENKITLDTKESISPTKLIYWITVSNLEELNVDGSGDIKVNEGFVSNNFKIAINGSGDIIIKDLNTESLSIIIYGSGDVKISGNGNTSNMEIEGSGDLIMNEFISKRVTAIIDGSGDIKINVLDYLKAIINGSGSIGYIGNAPTIETKINGSGDIYKLK